MKNINFDYFSNMQNFEGNLNFKECAESLKLMN